MLSETYNLLFSNTLNNFAKNIIATENDKLKEKQFSLFHPILGKSYLEKCELLVVGQATNGWCPKWFVQEVQGNNANIIADSIAYSTEEEGKCPLEWVNEKWIEYKLSHSFFWNVTYKLVKLHYGKTDGNWNNIIAWSNLMKIAPADRGNPNSAEIEAQADGAANLFRQEITDLKPKNVLVMTNLKTWAKPILEKAEIQFEHVDGQYAEAIGFYNKSKIIVTKRPFLGGKHEPFINEMSKLLAT